METAGGGPVRGVRHARRGGHRHGRRRSPKPLAGSRATRGALRGAPRPRGRRAEPADDGSDSGHRRDGSNDSGGGDDDDEGRVAWEAVARTILERMMAMEGRFQLVQRAVGDLQERSGSPAAAPENGDDDAGHDSGDVVAFTGVGYTPPAVPPADAPAPASYALSAIEKMDIAEWRNLSPGKRIIWMLFGERPVNASMTVLEMQVSLRHVANVSKDVAEMVNTLSGFEVQRFVGVGDDANAALTIADHLQYSCQPS